MEVSQLPKKFQEGFKVDYSKIKKCVMKKEIGETNDECKKMWENLGIEEAK